MNDLMLRMKQLEGVKRDYEDLFELITKFVNPRRELVKDSQRFDKKGQRRGKDCYDGTPSSALGVWADGMQGFMVAQNLKWFKSEMSDHTLNDIDEVRRFLQEYDEAMYAAFRRSNFYTILGEWFRDAGSVGTATLYTEEDLYNDNTVHLVLHPREVFIAENKYGQVDVVFRKFQLTARQALQKFPNGKLDDHIKRNAKEHPEKTHEFIHAVFPNDEPQFGSLLSTNKKYKSVYLQVTGQHEKPEGTVISEGGYDIFPYAVWRFRKNSDEVYGYSPAADAMASILKVNQIGKSLLKAAHLAVSPALNVPEQMRGNVKMTPSGENYFDDPNKIISPITSKIDFPVGVDREERLQAIIEDKYRVEFFLTLARAEREMTATEIMERQSEKAVLMGPQVDRLIDEGLSKVFSIVSEIEDKNGRLPEPPQVLLDYGGEIDIRFCGPLAQAQRRLFQMQPIKNGLIEIANAAVLFPNITDIIKEEEMAETILDSTDFPQGLMRSLDEVRQIREQRAAAQQQMQMMEQMQGAAEAYPKLAKSPEEGSPAEAIGAGMGA